MTAPIALQLYSVRDALAADFDGTLDKVAAMGYAGVEVGAETANRLPGSAQRLKDLGLTVCGIHTRLPLAGAAFDVLAAAEAFNARHVVCAVLATQLFESREGIQRAAALLNEASAEAQARGFKLSYHNHWWEFLPLEGRPAHDWLREAVAPEVLFELDVYWAQTGGVDPAAVVRQVGARAPLLHLKDGPAQRDAPMTALGDGVVDIPAVVAAGAGTAEWLIVELDECATDMLTAVERSYQYVVAKGLGHGQG